MPPDTPIRSLVRRGLYPLSWLILLFGFYRILTLGETPGKVWSQTTGALFPLYFLIEFTLPYERRWAMTWASFLADLKFAVSSGLTLVSISAVLGYFTITTAGTHPGPASDWSITVQVASALLIFEAINYTLHRAMHQMRGPIGRFLWRAHAAHHLPPRLYLVMHAVFHPINAVLTLGLAITLPVWLMGYGPEAAAIFLMINGMHGLISHFNVDIRAGWMNYLFVGPELHRYHHSADVREAGNFGATLPLFDILFGSFVYRPGVAPAELGVAPTTGLPPYEGFLAVMALPFRAD